MSDNFLTRYRQDGYGVFADMISTRTLSERRAEEVAGRSIAPRTIAAANNFASFAWDAAHLAAYALRRDQRQADGDDRGKRVRIDETVPRFDRANSSSPRPITTA